jgi:uncharacterized protein with GYD domain
LQGTYTEQGLKGLLKEGGSKRREAVEQLTKGVGGKLEVFYYAFGGDDFFIIVDVPSSVDAAAVAMTVNASSYFFRLLFIFRPEPIVKVRRWIRYATPSYSVWVKCLKA